MGWTSSLLSFARDERVILLSIGFATFGIVTTMVTALTIIRDMNEIPPTEPKPQYITQDTEDALQLDTLAKLIDHPNYSIREVAVKILCDRAINDAETTHALLYGITRPDYEERMRCLRALALLTGQTLGLDGLAKLNNQKAYSALVRSLELSLDDVESPPLNDEHWDEYYLRDMAERFCLMFILELVNKYGVDLLIKARFVEKWLAKQGWGTAVEDRRRNFRNYIDLKNNRIVDIIKRIMESRRGMQALEEAELVERDHFTRDAERLLIMEFGGESAPPEHGTEQQVPRTREHSAEEQRLRRQHREAMVLNDGTRPLGRDDIIERDYSPPTL
ncbi:cytoskeleton-associated [Paramyrothecium foliicola]|nr:cytoskeleton-associated [Paramyrothecium foliicola]